MWCKIKEDGQLPITGKGIAPNSAHVLPQPFSWSYHDNYDQANNGDDNYDRANNGDAECKDNYLFWYAVM